MRELKRLTNGFEKTLYSRTPPGVRELKRVLDILIGLAQGGRTPPGVRELKHRILRGKNVPMEGRTPPGVRELKHVLTVMWCSPYWSHPSRGA